MALRYNWSTEQEDFIRNNFFKLTNQQLADALGLKITSVRTKCYEMGLKRMELEYWTDDQIEFLRSFYEMIGDVELAIIFNELWHKNKTWTLKHIEKKRRYLGLKRSHDQIYNIKERNRSRGCFRRGVLKMWQTRGVTPDGTIKYWPTANGRMVPFIKINGTFRHWARYIWEQHHGEIPAKMNIVFKDGNTYNLKVENLEMITDGELSKRNAAKSITTLSDNYVAGVLSHGDKELRKIIRQSPALIELKRNSLKLNRIINESLKAS